MKIHLVSANRQEAMKEIHECVALQEQVGWAGEIVAPHIFRADSINLVDPKIDLGYLIVAKENWVDGFARVTTTANPKIHWLHEIVVRPSAQAKNLGHQIMLAAKVESLARGAEAIFFTFDPLESQNCNLYLRKCRAIATKLYANYTAT